jgi:hypothetical protein
MLISKYGELNGIREKYGEIIAKKYYRSIEISNVNFAWNIINDLLGRKKEQPVQIIKYDYGELITDAKLIAETLQSKFLSIVGVNCSEDDVNGTLWESQCVRHLNLRKLLHLVSL